MDLHTELYVVIAVGAVAQDVVKASRTSIKVLTTRSPLRSSNAQRERIRATFVQARMDAYPLGLDRNWRLLATTASHGPWLHLPGEPVKLAGLQLVELLVQGPAAAP